MARRTVTAGGRPELVCLAGVSGAGKDEVAKILVRDFGFVRVAIADHLKAVVMHAFGLGATQLWGNEREARDPVLGLTPRELYQRFGDACRELDPDVWLRPWRARVDDLRASGSPVVCTDLRTHAEVDAARRLGAELWLVCRPGAGAKGKAGLHPTETDLVAPGVVDFACTIDNVGTLPELGELVRREILAVGGRCI